MYNKFTKNAESLNPNRPGDLKEAFNICNDTQMEQLWPDDEVPGLRSAGQQFSQQCWTLAQRILLLMGHGLRLDDPSYFSRLHAKSSANNSTTLRCLFYPPLNHDSVAQSRRSVCPATPVSGTVLVNIGDVMARWTADKLISTKHRVVIPETQVNRAKARMSACCLLHASG
ncbi:hypothetical protein NP493_65g01006 [Ridgeia piscesae]|uniref:Isopenicillin N synthase-like Fe(2+) 2OG dioxygenase domain-containing protein n=1 Tax=Ridgeia piscesae TaxID=27915 RepID=A0AAD9PAC6_RIDPI|nr:hypothetical protein NP493_65g01006 [Ridgeia piscesae]